MGSKLVDFDPDIADLVFLEEKRAFERGLEDGQTKGWNLMVQRSRKDGWEYGVHVGNEVGYYRTIIELNKEFLSEANEPK